MQLHIGAALKQPGKVFSANIEEEFLPQDYAGRELRFVSPVQASLTYSYDGEVLALSGQLGVCFFAECARCNENFEEELVIPLHERFVKGGAALDKEESYEFEGEFVKLSTVLLDNIFLSLPLSSVCKAECAGLCPKCGCNWNTARCACVEEEEKIASPLSALEQLLNDDKEV